MQCIINIKMISGKSSINLVYNKYLNAAVDDLIMKGMKCMMIKGVKS